MKSVPESSAAQPLSADRSVPARLGVSDALAWDSLISDTGVAVVVIDETGKILFANQVAASNYGRRARELTDARYLDLVAAESGQEHLELIRGAIAENQSVDLEYTDAGTRRRMTIRPLPRDASGPGRALLMCRPMSEGDVRFPRPGIRHVRARVDDMGQLKSLTGREIEILKLIGSGLSTADIAKKLHRSVKTVEWHRVSLGSKLGVTNRVELAHIAIKAGMVDLQQGAGPEAPDQA